MSAKRTKTTSKTKPYEVPASVKEAKLHLARSEAQAVAELRNLPKDNWGTEQLGHYCKRVAENIKTDLFNLGTGLEMAFQACQTEKIVFKDWCKTYISHIKPDKSWRARKVAQLFSSEEDFKSYGDQWSKELAERMEQKWAEDEAAGKAKQGKPSKKEVTFEANKNGDGKKEGEGDDKETFDPNKPEDKKEGKPAAKEPTSADMVKDAVAQLNYAIRALHQQEAEQRKADIADLDTDDLVDELVKLDNQLTWLKEQVGFKEGGKIVGGKTEIGGKRRKVA